MSNVAEIGKCTGCSKMSRLELQACEKCRSRWGKRCGVVMSRIRTDPEFARKCHEALADDKRKQEFVLMFGKPWEATCRPS